MPNVRPVLCPPFCWLLARPAYPLLEGRRWSWPPVFRTSGVADPAASRRSAGPVEGRVQAGHAQNLPPLGVWARVVVDGGNGGGGLGGWGCCLRPARMCSLAGAWRGRRRQGARGAAGRRGRTPAEVACGLGEADDGKDGAVARRLPQRGCFSPRLLKVPPANLARSKVVQKLLNRCSGRKGWIQARPKLANIVVSWSNWTHI